MKNCPGCGSPNNEGSARCHRCGAALNPGAPQKVPVCCGCGQVYHATEHQIGKSLRCSCGKILVVGQPVGAPVPPGIGSRKMPEMASPGFARIAIGMAGLCGLLLAGDVGYQVFKLARVNDQLKSEQARSQLEHDAAVKQEIVEQARVEAEDEAKHQARLRDEAVISGALASQRHGEEWARRLAHDPAVAQSVMETNLLRMQQVGVDPTRSAQEALAEVARLAAPPGSRIEVIPSGDRFAVRVAFRMSALSLHESGAVTKHHTTQSMRREIERLSARVMKAMYDYCGTRGIEKLSITCNHALRRSIIPPNATESEKHELLLRAPVVFGRRTARAWIRTGRAPWRSGARFRNQRSFQ